jgi:hypothetical protein
MNRILPNSGYTYTKYKGIEWISSSKTKPKGMLELLVDNKIPGNIILRVDNSKNRNRYTQVSIDELEKLVKTNSGLYEVIQYPCHPYFDYDLKDVEAIKKTDTSKIVSKLTTFLSSHFPDAEFAVSGSFFPHRISLHITIKNYVVRNEFDILTLKSYVANVIKKIDDAFDKNVYTRNRCMKLVNQSKLDNTTKLLEDRIQTILFDKNVKNHFINIVGDSVNLKTIKHLESNVEVMIDTKRKFNLTSLPKFTISKNLDLDTLFDNKLNVLSVLPIDGTFDFQYKHRIGRWCFNNGLSFDEFFSWKIKSGTSNNESKWRKHWDRMGEFEVVKDDVITMILKKYYPKSFYRIEFKTFVNQFDIGKQIELESDIDNKHFEPTKTIIFNLPMGFGKTYSTLQYTSKKQSVLFITLNIALASSIYYETNEMKMGFEYYGNFTAPQKKLGKLNKYDKMIVCIDSLHYINRNFDVIVIDEIESCLDRFLDTTFMKNKLTNWNTLKNILKNTKKIIVLDAFTTMKTINVLKHFGEYTIYHAKPKNPRSIVYHKLPAKLNDKRVSQKDKNEYQNQLLLNKLSGDLMNDKKIWMFYPYVNTSFTMNDIQKYIENKTGKKVLIYNSMIDEKTKKTIGECNSVWINYDLVISNTSITCGVSFTQKYFNREYLCINGFNDSRQVIQNSYRARNLLDNKINVFFLGNQNKPEDFICDKYSMNCTIYNQLFDDILVEKHSQQEPTFQYFSKLAGYKQSIYKNEYPSEIEEISCETINYDSIKTIGVEECEELTNKIYNHTITFDEKLQIRKFHYDKLFTDDKTSFEVRETVWNYTLQQLAKHYHKESELFNSILEHNKLTEFPDKPEKIKLSEEHLDTIFKLVKFKYFKRNGTHSNLQIFTKFVNTFLSAIIYTTSQDDKKHIIHTLRNFDSLLYNINKIIEQLKLHYVPIKDNDELIEYALEEEEVVELKQIEVVDTKQKNSCIDCKISNVEIELGRCRNCFTKFQNSFIYKSFSKTT